MQKVSRPRYSVPSEFKIMAMHNGKNDRVWLRQMVDACVEFDRKRNENLRKVNRETSSSED